MVAGFIVGLLAGVLLTPRFMLILAKRQQADLRMRLDLQQQQAQLARLGVRSPITQARLMGMRAAVMSGREGKHGHHADCECCWCGEWR